MVKTILVPAIGSDLDIGLRWNSRPQLKFASDSPLEGDGFKLTVPSGSEPEDCPLALVALGYCRSILRLALGLSAATVGVESCVCA
jgi:hypothetical protein